MKITFVLPYASLAGGIRVVATYAKKLTERGHEITVVSQPRKKKSPFRQLVRSLRGKNPSNRVRALTPLLNFLGDQHIVLNYPRPVTAQDVPDADIIIATWWETAEWVAELPLSKGRKFHLLQDYEMFDYLPLDRVAATFKLPLQKIAVSSYIRSMVVGNHGIDNIEVIPNAVDGNHFNASPRHKNSSLTVGFLHSTSPRKQTSLAIEIITLTKKKIPSIKAIVFGAEPIENPLSLPDYVDFQHQPTEEDIPKIYASCDLWLFTSAHEGFGLPLLEAMACRTPVLATRAGAAPDLVNGKNGVLLRSDATAFVDQILRFDAMSNLEWQKHSDAAYLTGHSYSWDDATDHLLTLLALIPPPTQK